jgi:hypothetical protein
MPNLQAMGLQTDQNLLMMMMLQNQPNNFINPAMMGLMPQMNGAMNLGLGMGMGMPQILNNAA